MLIPLFVLLLCFLVDTTNTLYEKKKLEEVNRMLVSYALDQDNINEEELKKIVHKNDEFVSLTFSQGNRITIMLEKQVKSIFGQVVGIENYHISSTLTGRIVDNEKRIEK